jgi:hypothetical protein
MQMTFNQLDLDQRAETIIMPQAQTDKINQPIVIEKYMSDGPGFSGKIEFRVDGNRLTQTCLSNRIGQPSGTDDTDAFDLPVNMGEVVAVHAASSAQSEHIFNLMD